MEFHHISVLLEETIKGLVTDPAGTYVDCTLGGAGHSSRIAALLRPEGRLIGIDQDSEAIAAAGNAAVEAWALIQAQIAIMALAQEGAADDVAAARAILEG